MAALPPVARPRIHREPQPLALGSIAASPGSHTPSRLPLPHGRGSVANPCDPGPELHGLGRRGARLRETTRPPAPSLPHGLGRRAARLRETSCTIWGDGLHGLERRRARFEETPKGLSPCKYSTYHIQTNRQNLLYRLFLQQLQPLLPLHDSRIQPYICRT
jgi:hypothetical protein